MFSVRSGRLSAALLLALALWWPASVAAQPLPDAARKDGEPLLLEAREIVYDFERRLVSARGKVELTYGEQILLADEIRYDEAAGEVVAIGNIVLIDAGGEAVFADRLRLSDDLARGFVAHIRARDRR